MFIWQEYINPPQLPKPRPRPPSYLLVPPRRPLSLSARGPTLWHWIIVAAWAFVFGVVVMGSAGWL